MSEIKAIETVYNGYKFRSRLEARWAVFFDAAGIKYEYEPEGFELSDGTKYLPDFYLPEYDWYVEVKPNRDGACKDIERAVDFVGDKIKVLLILGDIPPKTNIDMYHYPVFYYNTLRGEVVEEKVCLTPEYEQNECEYYLEFITWLGVDHEHSLPRCEFEKYDFSGIHDIDIYTKEFEQKKYEVDGGTIFAWSETQSSVERIFINSCYDKARQARFEFGECG